MGFQIAVAQRVVARDFTLDPGAVVCETIGCRLECFITGGGYIVTIESGVAVTEFR